MEKEKTKFCAPLLNAYRWHESSHYRNGLPEPYSRETMTALDELFKMVRGISPYNKPLVFGSFLFRLTGERLRISGITAGIMTKKTR